MNDFIEIKEPSEFYKLDGMLYKEEVYAIVGCCFEVHKELGRGFLEAVYKEALGYEFEMNQIPFEIEKRLPIYYKNKLLTKYYNCDFIVDSKIILEIKAQANLAESNYKQTLNYLAASKTRLGLIVNFGESSLKFKRIIL